MLPKVDLSKHGCKDEKLCLKETIEEGQRKNFFKRIFPTIDFPYYKQFFEEDRPLNYYIDAKLFGKKRSDTASAKQQAEKMPLYLQKQITTQHLQSSPASGHDIIPPTQGNKGVGQKKRFDVDKEYEAIMQ